MSSDAAPDVSALAINVTIPEEDGGRAVTLGDGAGFGETA